MISRIETMEINHHKPPQAPEDNPTPLVAGLRFVAGTIILGGLFAWVAILPAVGLLYLLGLTR